MRPVNSLPRIKRISHGNHVLNLMLRACFGMVLFVFALLLLAWNEVNVVAQHQSLNEGKRHTVSLNANMMNAIDPRREGTLVHMTGDAVAVQSAQDSLLGVAPSHALRLARHVEMYQWIEEMASSNNKNENTGDSEFTYGQGWQTMVHQSDEFESPEGHENPSEMLFTSEEFVARPIQLGAYTLSDNKDIVDKLDWFEDMVNGVHVDQIQNETIRAKMQPYGSNGLYYGDDPLSPQIGDLRITYRVVPSPQTISIVAAQVGNSLESYQTSRSGLSVLLIECGSLSELDMYDDAHTTASLHAWKVRSYGAFLVYVALLIMVQPLKGVGGWIPLVRDIFGSATLCDLFSMAFMIVVGVIALSWMLYQPMLGLILSVIVGGYFRGRIQEARNAPVAEGYFVGDVEDSELTDDVEMHEVYKD